MSIFSTRQLYEYVYMPFLFSAHAISGMVLHELIIDLSHFIFSQDFNPQFSGGIANSNSHGCIMNQVFFCFLTASQLRVQCFSGYIFLLNSPTENLVISVLLHRAILVCSKISLKNLYVIPTNILKKGTKLKYQ